jgi:hypothetical protein
MHVNLEVHGQWENDLHMQELLSRCSACGGRQSGLAGPNLNGGNYINGNIIN